MKYEYWIFDDKRNDEDEWGGENGQSMKQSMDDGGELISTGTGSVNGVVLLFSILSGSIPPLLSLNSSREEIWGTLLSSTSLITITIDVSNELGFIMIEVWLSGKKSELELDYCDDDCDWCLWEWCWSRIRIEKCC